MRHWFLHVTPLLAALLGVWTPLSFARQTLRNRIDPVVGIVSQQQQQSGPQTFDPNWTTASWLANFWYQLGIQILDVPDHFFRQKAIQFTSGPLRLELFNAGGDSGGIPREFVIALANAMVGYTEVRYVTFLR
ncbi:hypothetical protein IMSHALPRED_001725 [Imshaugia aleurites]|uniref:Uncharacterized protein n=1 Tax=Imshaugia aleurites TaxID=172621 RepID=A0A8H3J3U7_9LECA|nr:hypothetical protein IMSHALPRED_001725 [Imshaugia aleurites]